MADLDAWHAAKLMGMGINIGNTLENTSEWETGWGNPRITPHSSSPALRQVMQALPGPAP